MRFLCLLCALATSRAALFGAPALRKQPTPTPVVPAVGGAEAVALRACAAGWTGLGVAAFSGPSSRAIVDDCFGLATATFEDNLREPAAGLLELTSPLFPLEAVLLVALASTIEIGPEDRCRVGGTLGLTSAAIASTFALAVGSGMPVNNPAAVGSVIALAAVTGALGASTVSSSAVAPLPLFREDARELTRVESALELFNANDVSTFYRSSTIVGLLVGAAFAFSPVSPIAVFDEELPVTHMMRQDVGVYIMALLCPVQAALLRAAKRGNLAEPSTRALNTATGLAIAALVFDGRAQVELGSQLYAALPADSPIIALVQSGDPSRPEANTTAAFSVGFLVACVYLFQAAFNREPSTSR